MSEANVRYKVIDPVLKSVGWADEQVDLEYVYTAGRILLEGDKYKRGELKKCDYLLSYRSNFPLAVLEAKSEYKSVGDGMVQAKRYAKDLDILFAYSSNGKAFLEYDAFTGKEQELPLDKFPSPKELYDRYKSYKKIDSNIGLIETPYYTSENKEPRYYQRIAINRTIEAIAKGQDKILLVMATGTGKTYTSFQIIHRLLKSGVKRKILYLADRNILIDQPIQNDFKPFQKIMAKVKGKTLDSAYEVYFSLYQQLIGANGEETFREFQSSFFDLIIIDECHRGSASADSLWHKVLLYFDKATHIGMTATPKNTEEVSNFDYFGEPIYTYSLKEGIDDGFLAPYKVVRIKLNKDESYIPEENKLDIYGNEIEQREYNNKDYDRNLIIDERTELVASHITRYLHSIGRYSRTIVFCVNIDHAERMRQALANCNADLNKNHSDYVVRLTGDVADKESQLYNFTNDNELYPVIATTSKLLTTGVDCRMCKLIVLDNIINSITEFKQIIGRGTRVVENKGKTHFTIMDFRDATRLFHDPEFDGDIEVIIDDGGDDCPPPEPPEPTTDDSDDDEQDKEPRRIQHINGVDVSITHETVSYIGVDGKLIVEDLRDYSRGNLLKRYASLNDFINNWSSVEKKSALVMELIGKGVFLEDIRKGQDIDEFDLICHLAFDKPMLTKRERSENVKKRGYLHKYSGVALNVLNKILDKYADTDMLDLDDTQILSLSDFSVEFGSAINVVNIFGGRDAYLEAVKGLQSEIYSIVG